MSFLSGGDKWRQYGETYQILSQQQQDLLRDQEFGRNLLSNIRQARLARSELAFSNFSDDVMTSSSYGATANIDSTLAGEYGYAIDVSKRLETIQNLNYLAQESYDKAATMDERSGIAGSLIGAVTTAAGVAIGGPVGGLIGASIGVGGTSALGGGSVARRSALSSALNTGASSFSKLFTTTSNTQNSNVISDIGGVSSSANYTSNGRRYYISDQGFGYSNIKGLMS